MGLGPPRSPPPRGSVGPEALPLPAAGPRGSQPLLVQSVPARLTGPPFARPRPPRGPPSPGFPLPLAAELGTARQPGALRGAGFPTRLRGPSRCARSSRPPSGLDTGEGTRGARLERPSLPGAQGAVAGTPQRFPSQSLAWDPAGVRRPGGKGTPGPPGTQACLRRSHPAEPGLAPAAPAGKEPFAAALCRLAGNDPWVQTCESPQGHPLINDDVLALSPAANLPPRNEICPL